MPPVIGAAVALGGALAGSLTAGAVGGTLGSVLGGVVALGAGIGGSYLAGLGSGARKVQTFKPPKQARIDYSQQIKENLTSTISLLPVLYGFASIPGIRVHCEVGPSPNFYLYEVFAFCEGSADSITNLQLDGYDYTSTAYSGKLSTWWGLGFDNQGSFSGVGFDAPSWTADHRLQGVVAAAIKCNKDATVFPRIPSVNAWVYRKLTDFRTGGTMTYGNPACCIYDYLINTRYGRGLPEAKLDKASFTDAANYCEALVTDLDGTKKYRYEISGLVDTSRTHQENLEDLLTACRGMLAFVGGKYRLIIDRPEIPVFHFNEDNITGSWKISRMGKRFRKNRMEAIYRSTENNWQPDLYAVESAYFQTVDQEPLVGKVDLPFVNTRGLAHRLIVPNLKQSRLDRRVEFTATQEALQVEVGNVVSLTHSTPGYDSKLFRVMRMVLLPSDEIQMVLEEYSDAVYDLVDLGDSDNIANFTVEPPGNLSIQQKIIDGRNEITASWEPADTTPAYYQLEFSYSGQGQWQILGKVLQTSFALADCDPGAYDFRVKAVSEINQSSDYSIRSVTIVSGASIPADVTGFAVSQVGNQAVLKWDRNADTLNSGFFKIRHSRLTSGAAWTDEATFEILVPGFLNSAAFGIVKGTYLIKAVNIAGTESAAMAAAVWDTGDDGYRPIVVDVESPTFNGTKTNLAAVDKALRLDSVSLFDSGAGNFDSGAGNFDETGGYKTSGTYQHDQPIDLGAILPVRLKSRIQADYPDLTRMFDSGVGNFDSGVGNFDGTDVLASVVPYFRTTQTDPLNSPVWTSWQALTSNDVTARGVDFKAEFSSPDASHNARVSILEASANMLMRSDTSSYTVPADGKNILFNKSFWSAPVLTAIIQNYQVGDRLTITSLTAIGFTVAVSNLGIPVSRTVLFVAIGAGYR